MERVEIRHGHLFCGLGGGWFVAEANDLWPCRPVLFLPDGVAIPQTTKENDRG